MRVYYPSIYFTALSIVNIIELTVLAYHLFIFVSGFNREKISSLSCKLISFLYSFTDQSRFIFLTILVHDRCLLSLGCLLESNDGLASSNIRAISKAVFGKMSAHLITVLSIMLTAAYNMFLW